MGSLGSCNRHHILFSGVVPAVEVQASDRDFAERRDGDISSRYQATVRLIPSANGTDTRTQVASGRGSVGERMHDVACPRGTELWVDRDTGSGPDGLEQLHQRETRAAGHVGGELQSGSSAWPREIRGDDIVNICEVARDLAVAKDSRSSTFQGRGDKAAQRRRTATLGPAQARRR